MTTVRELHDKAMELADAAIAAQRRSDINLARQLNREALACERQAALLVAKIPNSEPTRSVLLRSAATIALECGEIREAEKLVAIALAGDPPEEIAEELRDVMEQVYFSRHMSVRGFELAPDDIQLSIAGASISLGFGQAEHVIPRIDTFEKAIYRTAERKCGVGYSDQGSNRVRSEFEVVVSVPRAASFAVSFRVTRLQQSLFDNAGPAQVFEELLLCLSLYNNEDEERLRRIISDDSYYKNFVGLARRLQPDGSNVKLVGFTASLSTGYERETALTRAHNRIALYQPREIKALQGSTAVAERVTVRGRLRFASSTGKDLIRVVDDNKKSHPFTVPKGMMNDIVRPLWDRMVVATGMKTGKKVRLEDITAADES